MADACHKLENDTHGKSHEVNTSLLYIFEKFVNQTKSILKKKLEWNC